MTFNYTLNWSNDSLKTPFTLPAGSIDTVSTSLALTGKAAPNWGERVQENLIRLLEHFASPSAPQAPTTGQLWYDSSQNRMMLYTVSGQWVVVWPHPTAGPSPSPSPTPTPGPSPSPTPGPSPTPTPGPSPAIIFSGASFSPSSITTGQSTTLTLTFTSAVDQTVSTVLTLNNTTGGLTGSFGGSLAESLAISGGVGHLTYTIGSTASGVKTVQAVINSGTNMTVGANHAANVSVNAPAPSPTPTPTPGPAPSPTPGPGKGTPTPTPSPGTPVPSPAPTLTGFTAMSATPTSTTMGTNVVFHLTFTGTPNATNLPVNVNLSPGSGLSGPSGITAATVSMNSSGVGVVDFTYATTSTGTLTLNALSLLQPRAASVSVSGVPGGVVHVSAYYQSTYFGEAAQVSLAPGVNTVYIQNLYTGDTVTLAPNQTVHFGTDGGVAYDYDPGTGNNSIPVHADAAVSGHLYPISYSGRVNIMTATMSSGGTITLYVYMCGSAHDFAVTNGNDRHAWTTATITAVQYNQGIGGYVNGSGSFE